MRFSAEQHLRRPAEIRAVREQGQRIECRTFTVWWKLRTTTDNSPKGPARVCVIASTAAVGNAVRRNRAKRVMRETFRHGQNRMPANCDLLMIARRAVVEAPPSELEQRFEEACGKITAKAGAT